MSITNKIHSKELESTIKLIGDACVLHIINTLSNNPMRFCELQRALNNMNPTTLTDRLKKLEQEKIIHRKEETLDKLSVVYELSDKGKGTLPILKAIKKFAENYS